jgi:membrane protease YdiL (CAAX protease family)
VYLSCECGKRVTLTSAPERWPLPCEDCGKPVRIVDPETVGAGGDADGDPKQLEAPGGPGPLVRRSGRGGALAPREDHSLAEPSEGYVELEGRSFTGKRIRERVAVRPPETFGSETLAMALWLAAVLAILVGYSLVVARGDFSAVGLLAVSGLFALVTTVFVSMQWRVVRPALRRPQGFWLLVGLAGVPVGVILVLAWFKILEESMGTSFTDDVEEVFRDPSVPLPLLVLAVGALPGIFEELGFRGWMQSTWKLVIPPGRALILTACAFVAIHFSYFSIGWLLPFALYLGWLRERSGSIWPGVVAHMGHNTAMVLFVRFSG